MDRFSIYGLIFISTGLMSPSRQQGFGGPLRTPRNTRAVLHSARLLIESAKREIAGRLKSNDSNSRKSADFNSFHTPRHPDTHVPEKRTAWTEVSFFMTIYTN